MSGFNHFTYRIVKQLGLFHLSKYLTRSHPRILMYHRVSSGTGEREGLSLRIFERQMEVVKQHFVPMSLWELLRQDCEKSIPKNAVAVTFDDGYRDLKDFVYPVLHRLKIPATIFVTTGFINGECWLWPDKIKYVLTATKKKSLEVPEFSQTINLDLGVNNCWNSIAEHCLTLDKNEREKLINRLFEEAEIDCPICPPEQWEPVSWSELREFIKAGFEIGSHTVSHPVLTKVSVSELRDEVYRSKLQIRENLGVQPRGFCYPNGMPSDYNEEVADLVKMAGYSYAVTATRGELGTKRKYRIGRYGAGESMDDFYKNIYGLTYLSAKLDIRRGVK